MMLEKDVQNEPFVWVQGWSVYARASTTSLFQQIFGASACVRVVGYELCFCSLWRPYVAWPPNVLHPSSTCSAFRTKGFEGT